MLAGGTRGGDISMKGDDLPWALGYKPIEDDRACLELIRGIVRHRYDKTRTLLDAFELRRDLVVV